MLSIPKTEEIVLLIIFCVFLIDTTAIPLFMAKLIITPLGSFLVVLAFLALFYLSPLLGVVGIVVAYELIRRAYMTITYAPFPANDNRASFYSAQNQFPVSLEEIIIRDRVPYIHNNMSDVSFVPADQFDVSRL